MKALDADEVLVEDGALVVIEDCAFDGVSPRVLVRVAGRVAGMLRVVRGSVVARRAFAARAVETNELAEARVVRATAEVVDKGVVREPVDAPIASVVVADAPLVRVVVADVDAFGDAVEAALPPFPDTLTVIPNCQESSGCSPAWKAAKLRFTVGGNRRDKMIRMEPSVIALNPHTTGSTPAKAATPAHRTLSSSRASAS
jgi:hypothetical protein